MGYATHPSASLGAMRDPESPSAKAIRESKELVRAIESDTEETRRQIQAGRALVERCKQLLRKLRGGDRVDDQS
jgi:hypothetical protein